MSRRTKWHPTPPPPPSPKILLLPRRRRTLRRNQSKRAAHPQREPLLHMNPNYDLSYKDNLENLFHQESNLPFERRERVEEKEECGRLSEEKWRFQAEMLRAECNLLRMERGFALKKLEKKRVEMETTLRSAVRTLVSGRKKIGEGNNGNEVLEKEIEDLEEKIEELQKSSRLQDWDVQNCSNFDKKACLLQRRLEKHGEGVLSNAKEQQQVADSMNRKRGQIAQESRVSDDKFTHEVVIRKEEKCSGRCKAMVLRIMEQVRAETEQWSQMQSMLHKVRGEMEEMQASRDYWQRQAHNSDCQTHSLRLAVEEWKERALEYEEQVKELQLKLSLLKQMKKKEDERSYDLPLGAQLVKERLAFSSNLKKNNTTTPEKEKELPPLSLAKQIAKEKRSIIRSLKENKGSSKQDLISNKDGGNQRSPLKNIANSSSLLER